MARTRQTESKPGPLDAIGLGALGATRMSDISRGLRRYRGPGMLVVGIVLLSAVLPGPSVFRTDVRDAASAGFSNPPATDEPAVEETVEAPVETTSDASSELSFSTDSTFSPSSPSFSGSSFSSSDTPSSSSSSAGSTSSGFSRAPKRLPPLTIVAAAWSSASAGTPVAARDVPEDSLPVGMRVGQDDKLSFVKLQGDESVLRLFPVEEGQRSPETAAILACPVTTDEWAEAQAMSFSEDPEYDCATAAEGKQLDDGSWAFDLSQFPTPTDSRGFALVPAGEGLADFQVAFRRGA